VSPGSMSFHISQRPSDSGRRQNRQPPPSLAASGQAHFADNTAMRQCTARHRCFIFESPEKRLKIEEIQRTSRGRETQLRVMPESN
jgi:hypothetical protein